MLGKSLFVVPLYGALQDSPNDGASSRISAGPQDQASPKPLRALLAGGARPARDADGPQEAARRLSPLRASIN